MFPAEPKLLKIHISVLFLREKHNLFKKKLPLFIKKTFLELKINMISSYLVMVEDVKHFLEPTLLDGIGFTLFVTEEGATKGGKVGQRHQTVAVKR